MRFLFLFMLTIFFSCGSSESAIQKNGGQTMIVLGFPANADGSPSRLLKYRLDRALGVYKKEKISNIIVTGGAVQNRYAEADVMKQYLIEKGIKPEKIIAETRANSTFGNAYYSSKILRKLNSTNPIIVTSEEHEERAGKTFSIFISEFRFPD